MRTARRFLLAPAVLLLGAQEAPPAAEQDDDVVITGTRVPVRSGLWQGSFSAPGVPAKPSPPFCLPDGSVEQVLKHLFPSEPMLFGRTRCQLKSVRFEDGRILAHMRCSGRGLVTHTRISGTYTDTLIDLRMASEAGDSAGLLRTRNVVRFLKPDCDPGDASPRRR